MPNNGVVRPQLLNRATAAVWLTGLGVLLSGVTDWLQGVAPEGIVSTPSAVGLAIFIAAVVGTVALALRFPDTSEPPIRPLQLSTIALAAVAAAFGDPTYGVLLFAVPLIEIARRRSDSARYWIIGGVFVLAAVLVAVERSSWAGNDLEATLIVFIALLITTMLGDALGRLDDARRLEADLARVDERQHLARELHDSVGHSLLAASIQLRTAVALWDRQPDGARSAAELAGRAIDEALVDTRFAVDRVRAEGPLFDLEVALGELAQRVESPTLDVDVTVDGDLDYVDQLTQITLYRVAQEALTNVVRHADAKLVAIAHSVTGGEATLSVTDDGQGFDLAAVSHMGLRSLTERLARVGGRLDVRSAQGQGTALSAVVELNR